jgi:hypothetical protein
MVIVTGKGSAACSAAQRNFVSILYRCRRGGQVACLAEEEGVMLQEKSHWLRGAKPPLLVLGPRVASWCSLVAIQETGVSPELYPTMITNNQGEARNKRSSVVGEICFGVTSLILIVGLLSSVSSLLTASTDSDCIQVVECNGEVVAREWWLPRSLADPCCDDCHVDVEWDSCCDSYNLPWNYRAI